MGRMRALLFYILIFGTVVAQAQTHKFGDVPREQLEMEVYDKDSTARAVVIFSKGEAELNYLNEKFFLTVSRHVRIKILTDEGLDEGDITIRFRNKNSNVPQNVSRIKAESYTLDDNGKVVKESVGRRDRFEEEVSEFYNAIKFTVPGLKNGSIFEYSYEITSTDPLDFPDWLFQDEIPVMWSEYTAKIPEWFRFLTVKRGFQDYHEASQKGYSDRFSYYQKAETIREGLFVKEIPAGNVNIDFQGTEFFYAMKDLPGIYDEPYMKTSLDYLSHIRFQLSAIQFPGAAPTIYLDSWIGLVNKLLDDEDYGNRLKNSSVLEKATTEAIESAESDLEKVISIYNKLSKHMEWDENYSLYAFEDLAESYENGAGNGTSINLILVQMLRKAGLEAHPIILSTRFNGEIVDIFPLAQQFNHTIAYVQFGNEYYLLDATNEQLPYNMLPIQALNGQGLLVFKDEVLWVPLENKVNNVNFNMINIEFTDNGLKGSLNSQNQGYYAVDLRNILEFNDLENSAENVFKIEDGLIIDSVSITKDKLDESFNISAEFTVIDSTNADVVYFNPMMVQGINENPFKLTERTFPVDFNYTFSESMVMNISIPEGWVVDEIPKSVLYRLQDQSGEFRRIVQNVGDKIMVNYRFKLDKKRYMPNEYDDLKELYNQMVELLGQNIVLKKGS